jgi:hypothetical protein
VWPLLAARCSLPVAAAGCWPMRDAARARRADGWMLDDW